LLLLLLSVTSFFDEPCLASRILEVVDLPDRSLITLRVCFRLIAVRLLDERLCVFSLEDRGGALLQARDCTDITDSLVLTDDRLRLLLTSLDLIAFDSFVLLLDG